MFKVLPKSFLGLVILSLLLNGRVYAGKTTQITTNKGAAAETTALWYKNSLSANGRYIVFPSDASNLVADDTNGMSDIFIHDLLHRKTNRLSVALNGKQGNANSALPSISADGRYVTFASEASNLVPGDTNNQLDVFVHDLLTKKTTRVSVSSKGIQSNGASAVPSISADGRYVAFASDASNLVNHDTNKQRDVFVHDRLTQKTARISLASNGLQGNADSSKPDISGDGRFIAFVSLASNLVAGGATEESGVFVHDRISGKTTRASVNSDGEIGDGYSGQNSVSISADGRYVSFASDASNLVADDTNGVFDIFVHDRLGKMTNRVSVNSTGIEGNDTSLFQHISADGRYVTFSSEATNLVTNDTNDKPDVFIYDRVTKKTTRVSIESNNNEKDNNSFVLGISADSRYIAFMSVIDYETSKENSNIFVRDRLLDTKHHADLQITPTQKPATLKPNTQGSYLYTITNNGKDAVPDISLIHLVSGGSAVSFKPSQGKCSFSPVETVCHLGKLAAGKKTTLSVTVKAQSKAFSQQVSINGAPVDAVPGNNQITVTTPVK